MKDLLSTNGLTKKFGRYKVVNAVNIHIRQGDIYGLIGQAQNEQNVSQGVDGKSISVDRRQGKRCAESQGGDRAVWTGARDKQYPGCLPV